MRKRKLTFGLFSLMMAASIALTGNVNVSAATKKLSVNRVYENATVIKGKTQKKNVVKVSLKNNTIPHEITGKWGATTLWMAPAYEGTGVIAGSASREILELVGVHDILTKIKGSRNKHNVAKATVEALKLLRTAQEIADLRGLEVKDILS